MQIIKLRDLQNKRIARQPKVLPEAIPGARIKVLASGCPHCRAMRQNVIDAVAALKLPEGSLACIDDLTEIGRIGVMATPSLVIDGKLVSSGKVLKPERIMELIKLHCPDLTAE